jgi:hypothetical protein
VAAWVRLNWIPLAIAAAWAGLVVWSYEHWRRTGEAVPTCNFRRFTGLPCATCGGTRAGMALLSGRPLEALAWNPLVTVSLVGVPAWAAWRVWKPARPWGRTARIVAWSLAAAAFLGNWAYVLWRQG